MVRSRRFFYVVLSLLLACFFLSGCAAHGPQTGDVKEDFLIVYGTYNYEGRYEVFRENLENAAEDTTRKKLLAAMDEYYACVRDYVSEDFYQNIRANREIFKYEKYTDEKGYTYRTDGFEFAEYARNGDKTTYSFVAHLILTDSGGAEERGTVKGQITVQEKDGEALVTNFYLSPTGFVPDNA
ncbi:MAG TPA: hypothetical protein VN512_12920 [Clostridia bacterium]|nr:hypothetical protein [Clostridia bacterium]